MAYQATGTTAIPGQQAGEAQAEWQPPQDFWRCLRQQPVSGRYEGGLIAPGPANVIRQIVDLRVDIDPAYPNSPVMNRVSGDLYRVVPPVPPAPPGRVYQESWVIEAPAVTWRRCEVEIAGAVRWWTAPSRATTARITIPWSSTSMGPAMVVFIDAAGGGSSYTCHKQSLFFRSMTLEIDVCRSVQQPPLLPSYDTHAHGTRPPGAVQRLLTIEETYREAGVDVSIDPAHTEIDDSAAGFSSWSPAELHDAMEVNFSRFGATWPAWQMWGLLAGLYDRPKVGGVMYDAAAQFGGAGEGQERQGFAVFRKHSWFADLPAGPPASQVEAAAVRKFLYTYVHEAGHAFNFLHSWDKNRPDALSWMNYDWKYDERNGTDSFWTNFLFRFDDEELAHIRHGNRASVIMGGDPWSSGGHLEAPGAMTQLLGSAQLEFCVRSKEYFEFLEPVSIELRLRNLSPFQQVIDARLSPEFGSVALFVRHPNGKLSQYSPIFCNLGLAEERMLEPAGTAIEGADRYSENVFVSFGKYGFYFDEPGQYLVRAVYQGTGDLMIPSNTWRLRIGNPPGHEQDRLGQDYFSHEVGMSLYLGGSQSPLLQDGMEVLEDLAERASDSVVGAKAAEVVASSVSRSFYRLEAAEPTARATKLKKTHDADPERAVELTTPALEVYRQAEDPKLNLSYHELARTRAEALAAAGKGKEAKTEIRAVQKDLKARGVNESVLREMKDFEQAL